MLFNSIGGCYEEIEELLAANPPKILRESVLDGENHSILTTWLN